MQDPHVNPAIAVQVRCLSSRMSCPIIHSRLHIVKAGTIISRMPSRTPLLNSRLVPPKGATPISIQLEYRENGGKNGHSHVACGEKVIPTSDQVVGGGDYYRLCALKLVNGEIVLKEEFDR